jgi:predicted molibdopterin-dependent oxidoreductase YjgC
MSEEIRSAVGEIAQRMGAAVLPFRTCDFCGKPRTAVKFLVAGPRCHICEECVEVCQEIIREETAKREAGKSSNAE